jgi:hypothetical protein
MSAIQTVRQQIQQLISTVTDLNLIREWYTLQSSENLEEWVQFLIRLEQMISMVSTPQHSQTEQDNIVSNLDFKNRIQEQLKRLIPFFHANPTIFQDLENVENLESTNLEITNENKQSENNLENDNENTNTRSKNSEKDSESEIEIESDFENEQDSDLDSEIGSEIFDLESENRTRQIAKTKLIAGHVQSGKSAVICGLAVYLVAVLKKPVVIVVRNYTADYQQLASKFDRNGTFGIFDVIVHYAKTANTNQIFHPRYPAITICLEHQTQLKKLVEAHKARPEEFCLIADEADAVCYKDNYDRERIAHFTELSERAQQFIAVTATAFDMLYLERKLDNRSIYKLPIPESYKGIDHPDFSFSPLPTKFDFALKCITPAIYELSESMQQFYSELANTPVFQLDNGGVNYHPVICLHKTESIIKKQIQYLAALARHPVFGKEFVVMTYNGEGVYLYSPFDIGRTISETHGSEPKLAYLADIHNVYHYKDMGIHQVLQHLKTLNRPDRITHIVIIGGQMVSRGLNIVSTDYQWHLTHQIYKVSTQSTCAEDIQGCRIFGVYRDNIPTKLFCLQKDINNITQAQQLQERIYEGANFYQLTESLPELCEKIKVFKGLIPRKRTSKKCAEPLWNRVSKKEYQYDEMDEGEYYCILPEKLGTREKEIYDYTVDYLFEKRGTWVSRTEIVGHIIGFNERENTIRGHLSDMCRFTHKYTKTPEDSHSGLLFKQQRNRWFIRLN